jgi:hypothetical protein
MSNSVSGLARHCLVVVLGATLAACGTVYLHDPAGEAAATAARTQFQETLAKGRLSDLVATYRAQNAEQIAATRALQQDSVRTQMYTFSAKSWAEIILETRTELTNTKEATAKAVSQLTSLDKTFTATLQAHEEAATRVGDLVAALNRAAATETRYAASQKLLAAALQAMLDHRGTGGGQAALEEVLKAKVKGRTFNLDKSGVLVETPTEEEVGKALGIDAKVSAAITPGDPVKTLKALTGQIKGLESFQGLQLNSPGIAVTIVGLGYDVARAEERRLAVTIDEVRRTRALYREQVPFLAEQQARLQRNLTQLESLDQSFRAPEAKLNPDKDSVEAIILRLRTLAIAPDPEQQKRYRNTLITFYRQIGDNFQFRVIDAQARDDFENAVTVLQAERALALTEVNLRERELVIVRGLDGLVAFHHGGIDAGDIRNLILLAQTFGVIAIAAK